MILAFLVFLQEEATILRGDKEVYLVATGECDKAAGMLEGDPRGAIDLLDRILDNAAVQYSDCRLKIEVQPATYKKYDFFPHQLRGRARMRLADRAERSKAVDLLKGAVQDFDESFTNRKLASSKPFLEEARKKLHDLEAINPDRPDPEPDFKRAWKDLLAKGQFTRAKRYVQGPGGFLSEEKRKRYLADTERDCLEFVGMAVGAFLGNLETLRTPRAVTSMTRAALERTLELPEKAELVATTPAYEWSASLRATLAEMRDGKDVLDRLLDHAVRALVDEPRGFAPVEILAFEVVREAVTKRADEAQSASAEGIRNLRSQAEALAKRWKDFDARARKSAPADSAGRIPSRDLAALLEEFPVEDASVDRIGGELRAVGESGDPLKALSEAEKELTVLAGKLDRLPLDARRTVVTYRIAAGATRGFLDEKSEEEVARDLRALGSKLKELGGSFDVKGFGPKIQAVFARLR